MSAPLVLPGAPAAGESIDEYVTKLYWYQELQSPPETSPDMTDAMLLQEARTWYTTRRMIATRRFINTTGQLSKEREAHNATKAENADLKRKLEQLERTQSAKRQKTYKISPSPLPSRALGVSVLADAAASVPAVAVSSTGVRSDDLALPEPGPDDEDMVPVEEKKQPTAEDERPVPNVLLYRQPDNSLSLQIRGAPVATGTALAKDTRATEKTGDQKQQNDIIPFDVMEEVNRRCFYWARKEDPRIRVASGSMFPAAVHYVLAYATMIKEETRRTKFVQMVLSIRGGPNDEPIEKAINKLLKVGLLKARKGAEQLMIQPIVVEELQRPSTPAVAAAASVPPPPPPPPPSQPVATVVPAVVPVAAPAPAPMTVAAQAPAEPTQVVASPSTASSTPVPMSVEVDPSPPQAAAVSSQTPSVTPPLIAALSDSAEVGRLRAFVYANAAGDATKLTIDAFVTQYQHIMDRPVTISTFDRIVSLAMRVRPQTVRAVRRDAIAAGRLPAVRHGIATYVMPLPNKWHGSFKNLHGEHKEQNEPATPPSSPVIASTAPPTVFSDSAIEHLSIPSAQKKQPPSPLHVLASASPLPAVVPPTTTEQKQDDYRIRITHEACRLAAGGKPTVANFYLAYHSFMTKKARATAIDDEVARMSGRKHKSVELVRGGLCAEGRLPYEKVGRHVYILPRDSASTAASSSSSAAAAGSSKSSTADDDTETDDDRLPLDPAFRARMDLRAKALADVKAYGLHAGQDGGIGPRYYALAYIESLLYPQDIDEVVEKVSQLSGVVQATALKAVMTLFDHELRPIEIEDQRMPNDDIITMVLPLKKPIPGVPFVSHV